MKLLASLLIALMFSVTAHAVTLKGAKTIGNVFGNEREIVRVIYDFSVDGGATGDYTCLTAESDVLVRMVGSKSIVAGASGGSADLDVGIGASGVEFESSGAIASYSLNAFVFGDSEPFIKVADGSVVNLGIDTATLTAGKIEFIFEVVKF